MEQVIFRNKKYGNTVFEIEKDRVGLRSLMGMPMYYAADNSPKRLMGITDSDTSVSGRPETMISLKSWKKTEDSFTLCYQAVRTQLQMKTVWKAEREQGIITRRDVVCNEGEEPVILHRYLPKFFFASGKYECYVQNSTWCYENRGGWESLGRSGVTLQCEGGRTTQGASPMLGLRDQNTGRGVVFHIIPKGNWEIRLQKASVGVGPQGSEIGFLRLGQSADGFACELPPGGTLEFPEILIQGLPEGNLYRETENMQRWLRQKASGRHYSEHRIVYNPWFNCFDDIDVEKLLLYAKSAKELGCEIFEVDAGWYGREADWSSSVGDWREKLDGAFYGRLAEFADRIRELGMGFGLWMEPERIMEGAPIRREHPEWFAGGSSGGYYPKLWEKEPYEYIRAQMLRLIEEYGLAWMKIDFNFELEEDPTNSGFLYYYEAFYRLIDEIKSLHPEVFLEACASGGLRSDINTMLHFDAHFICDNVNPYDGANMYEQLLIRSFPTRVYQWMAVQKGADIPAYFREVSDVEKTIMVPAAPGAGFADFERIGMDFLCKLMVHGMFGISGDITSLDEEDRRILSSYIDFYKKYRPLLLDSLVSMDSEASSLGERDRIRTLQYYSEKLDESLLFVYRFGDIRSILQVFPGHIREGDVYLVEQGGGRERRTGRELLENGLTVELKSRNSGVILHICPEKKAEGAGEK